MASAQHHLIEIPANPVGMGSFGFGGQTISHSCSQSCSDLDSSTSPCIEGYNHTWPCTYTNNPSAGTVSLVLSLPYPYSCSPEREREPLNAWFKFSLLDRHGRPVPSRTRASCFQNWRIPQSWKWECPDFITRDDVERQELYLNKDGRFAVRCDIAVKPVVTAADAFVTVPPSDLHRHLGGLLARKDGADVTFQVVAGGGGGGETFSAHRCVLAARSPVFRAQLFGAMMESQRSAAGGGVIPIEGMEAHVFGSLLAFVYTDSLPPETTGHNAEQDGDDDEAMVLYQHLLAAADRYGLDRMKLICQEKLCTHIRADSVAAMLALADRHHCPGLKEAFFHFLTSGDNLESFTDTDGFEVLNASCPAVLKELLAKLATVLIL